MKNQDVGLSEFKSFSGNLQEGCYSVPITFFARIDSAGNVEFDFGAIAVTQETRFILERWDGEGAQVTCFSLSGNAEDGTELKTEDLYFNSLENGWHKETGSRMKLVGGCSRAEFRRKLVKPTSKPLLRMHVKGFQNFPQLSVKCCLGLVVMNGDHLIKDMDTLTGYIVVQSDNEPADLAVWHVQADKLLEHIRRVMSFASASVLKGPVIEFYSGDELIVIALSQTRQAPASFRTFHHLNQQPIFDAAVTSFFNSPFKVKNLFFAIEWFAMEATYNEVQLVNAMTALENLVASNLSECDTLVFPKKEFNKKIAQALRKALRESIEEVTTEEARNAREEMLEGLYAKLGDVNRQSIFQKLMTLANNEHWSVPLDGISKEQIEKAIKARNHIVHRGHYYDNDKEGSGELWEHVTVVREIVVRFLLTVIGYRGSYFSYIGGCHDAQFPPQGKVIGEQENQKNA